MQKKKKESPLTKTLLLHAIRPHFCRRRGSVLARRAASPATVQGVGDALQPAKAWLRRRLRRERGRALLCTADRSWSCVLRCLHRLVRRCGRSSRRPSPPPLTGADANSRSHMLHVAIGHLHIIEIVAAFTVVLVAQDAWCSCGGSGGWHARR